MSQSFDKLIQAIPGVVYELRVKADGGWQIVYLSDGVQDLYECTPQAGCADHHVLTDCILAEDMALLVASVEKATKNLTPWSHEYRIRTPSGQIKWIKGQARPEQEPDGAVLWQGFFVDISANKATETRLLRLQRLYAAATETGRIISRVRNQAELFREICKVAVELGGMKMAWIGVENENSQQIIPVTRYGEGTGYLDEICISTRPDLVQGQGPTGIAYRESRCIINNDFLENPATKHWHAPAQRYNWGASATFPIQNRETNYAVFSVYSAEKNAFDQDVVALLEQLAADISRAVSALAEQAERKKMEQALAESEERFSLFMDTLPAAAFIKDVDGTVLYVNRYMASLLGTPAWKGKSTRELLPPELAEPMMADDLRALEAGHLTVEEQVPHPDNRMRFYQTHKFRISRQDQPPLLGGIAIDITERKRLEEQIRDLAYFDPLTKLPNRRMLLDRLTQALNWAKRHDCSQAILFLDLDEFKSINDTYGHDVGDELLKEVADRLRRSVRAVDTVSRHGGDEFIILLPEISQPDDAARVADKIIQTIQAPIRIADKTLLVSASIGIAISPFDSQDTPRELLRKADKAMYEAKEAGRNRYRFFVN